MAAEAARTIPGREHGGNCDIKNLTKGCKVSACCSTDEYLHMAIKHHVYAQVYFPVFVEGAKLSMGDMHFSQGDGEVSFCGAIEINGFLHLK